MRHHRKDDVPGDNVTSLIDWNKTDEGGAGHRKGGNDSESEGTEAPDLLRMALGQGYDPTKFYISSADSKGHQYTLNKINLPQSYAGLLGLIRDYYPEYRTNADVVRDALVHRLSQLNARVQDGEITQMMLEDKYQAQLEYNRVLMELGKKSVDDTKLVCELALANKDYTQLDKVLQTLDEKLHEEDDRSPYARDLEKLWKNYAGEMRRIRKSGEWDDSPVVKAIDWNTMKGSGKHE